MTIPLVEVIRMGYPDIGILEWMISPSMNE